MIYLESNQTDPYFNLALEEYIFEQMDRGQQYFMLWQNDNTIVVGKYQNTAEEINRQYVDMHGIHVARRLSGGGAVYHDKGNLNFTFIVDQKSGETFDFSGFVRPVIRALETLGVHAEFNGRNDITIEGRKISGNAQYGRHGRWLHHGCIMLDSNLDHVSGALNVRAAKFESKSVKSARSRVTTINAHTPKPVRMEDFKAALRGSILEEAGQPAYGLSPADLEAIQELRKEKYATWDWNYGASPKYDMRREIKFPSGLVTAFLQVAGGRIDAVRLYGDFFGNGDLRELERALVGLRLDENMERAVSRLNIGHYINGLSPADLCLLLK